MYDIIESITNNTVIIFKRIIHKYIQIKKSNPGVLVIQEIDIHVHISNAPITDAHTHIHTYKCVVIDPFMTDLYLGETPQYIPYMATSTAPRNTAHLT